MRDPVHGFIEYDDWEQEVLNHSAFQRLRRIRQLALTELVYPGATHTRFAHALGTMHVATRMFDAIVERQRQYLLNDRHYDDAGISRDRQIVRLAALLHDVGHSPFSHSGEALFPVNTESDRRYHHEEYSANIIESVFKDVIENHPGNANYEINSSDVAALVSGDTNTSSLASVRRLIWRPIVTSQLDADRCDYLLRDSLHTGVAYGNFDLERVLATLTLGLNVSDDPVIAIEEGGWHAAEGLIIARYSMFTQVYFHHTRLAFDHHVEQVLSKLLTEHYGEPVFPMPDQTGIHEYLTWDDWRVLGAVASGSTGLHGDAIKMRNPFRSLWHTSEIANDLDNRLFDQMMEELGNLVALTRDAAKSWYSLGDQDLPIVPDRSLRPQRSKPLSSYSTIVRNMNPVSQRRIYVESSHRREAERIVGRILSEMELNDG